MYSVHSDTDCRRVFILCFVVQYLPHFVQRIALHSLSSWEEFLELVPRPHLVLDVVV